jgi:ring-1,2-phenylacetyl-CoA epoxidase subunit PaaD
VERSPAAVWAALEEVPDPELPRLSIVGMGMVDAVAWDETGVRIELVPAFVGCPALDWIRARTEETVAKALGVDRETVTVRIRPARPWSSDRIRPEAREALRGMGIAVVRPTADGDPGAVHCPYCGDSQVRLENLFASTACRSLYYCERCRNPFEAIKVL